jgi:hypothetical protein
MDVRCFDDASEFLAATEAYRSGDPLRTNVMGTVATSVVDGSREYPGGRWWTIADGAAVVGAAMHTPPSGLLLGPMGSAACSAFAAELATADDDFPWVAGPIATIDATLAAYAAIGSAGSRRSVASIRRDVLYVARDITQPSPPGAARQAVLEEFDQAFEWFGAFSEEVDGVRHEPSERDIDSLRTTIGRGRLWWWCVDDAIVSMAGHTTAAVIGGDVVTRVGPVYTPPEQRGRGYAGAVTAVVTTRLQATGSTAMLFADEANPISNHVYRSIGYERIDTLERRVFEEAT